MEKYLSYTQVTENIFSKILVIICIIMITVLIRNLFKAHQYWKIGVIMTLLCCVGLVIRYAASIPIILRGIMYYISFFGILVCLAYRSDKEGSTEGKEENNE